MEHGKTAAASLSRLIQQEEESSQKHQLQCFFNHVLLGQWELARSTSRLICQNPSREDRRRVLNALIDIASNPYEQRYSNRFYCHCQEPPRSFCRKDVRKFSGETWYRTNWRYCLKPVTLNRLTWASGGQYWPGYPLILIFLTILIQYITNFTIIASYN